MKNLLTLALTVAALAAFSTSTFAGGNCGGCTDGEKSKDKASEGAQS
jgi:hypothetical protein